MINPVRLWTRKPSPRFFAVIESEERPSRPKRTKQERSSFFGDFLKMWENHAEMVVRNMDGDLD